MEFRLLGKTGPSVSELGVCLPADAALAERIAIRAAREGVNCFFAPDDAVAHAIRRHADVHVAIAASHGPIILQPNGTAGIAIRSVADVPQENSWSWIAAPYNLIDQQISKEVFAPAARDGRGIVAVHVLAGGALAGPVGHTPPGAVVNEFRSLIKPKRTLAQAAIQFVLANQYVTCAAVAVSSEAHLAEALGALDAEPLTMRELELIFETYANRYDRR
jgi:hypothetical protein